MTSTAWPEGQRVESAHAPAKEPYVLVRGSGRTVMVVPDESVLRKGVPPGIAPYGYTFEEEPLLAMSGYSVRFQPALGFSAIRLGPNNAPRPDSIKIGTAKGSVIIVPGQADGGGQTEVQSGDKETPVEMIGKTDTVASFHPWTIETDRYTCAWPRAMGVNSNDPSDAWPFELYGPEDSMVFLRGPSKGPPPTSAPAEMVGRGQTVVGQKRTSNGMWLELEYEHGGRTWRQRHHWVGFPNQTMVVVTGQAPKELFPRVGEAMDEVVSSLVLRAN